MISIYTHPLFDQMDKFEVDHLLHCLNHHQSTYHKDEIVYHFGDKIHHMGIILEGQIFVSRHDIWGHTFLINQIEEGETFGESYAIIGELPQDLSIEAKVETTILFIDYSKILDVCNKQCFFHYQFIHNLLQLLSKKNRILASKLSLISKKTIREKLLQYLSSESLKQNTKHLLLPFNRQELADYLNVDRSALSHELMKMKKDNLIDYEKNEIYLKI